MAERLTFSKVQIVFDRVSKICGWTRHCLDYNPTMGGYHVTRLEENSTGERVVSPGARMTAGECVAWLRGVEYAHHNYDR